MYEFPWTSMLLVNFTMVGLFKKLEVFLAIP